MELKVFRLIITVLLSQPNLLWAEWNTKDFQKREHSLIKPYQGSGFGVPNWDFQGSTMVTSNYIRLTPDQRSKQGALWNKIPCTVRNWEVQISFKVTGSTKELFGDGFAFWYTKERMENGPVFGSKDLFSGLTIIGDTYSNHNAHNNHQHPYLSAMVNNGSVSYDHERDGKGTMLGGCEVKFRNMQHETWIAIRYENDKLTISHDLHNKRAWAPCFSMEGVKLPTGYYFGMSATTGDLSDAHDVISIRTYELDTVPGVSKEERPDIMPEAEKFVSKQQEKTDNEDSGPSMSGMKKFFVCLLVVLGLVVLAVVGIMIYQNQQENNRKRFY
eukprot:TRINITY_DN7993_c0_g1_i4.p1 TRINITY_DN7993_c0_g1~~TRINITY_DN7993_c0_g1_i4.p1  ORF type:complete len:329 (-),score=69.60 TRINITY_DN7993_c0_g1_i4:243-1229(-)